MKAEVQIDYGTDKPPEKFLVDADGYIWEKSFSSESALALAVQCTGLSLRYDWGGATFARFVTRDYGVEVTVFYPHGETE